MVPPFGRPVRPESPGVLEYIPARYKNPDGAPLVISDARTGIVARAGRKRAYDTITLPTVTLVNTTDRRITAIKLRFKWNAEEHAVTAMQVSIRPHCAYVYTKTDLTVLGDAERMSVQVLGVVFENGDVWGSMDSTISTRIDWVAVPLATRKQER